MIPFHSAARRFAVDFFAYDAPSINGRRSAGTLTGGVCTVESIMTTVGVRAAAFLAMGGARRRGPGPRRGRDAVRAPGLHRPVRRVRGGRRRAGGGVRRVALAG